MQKPIELQSPPQTDEKPEIEAEQVEVSDESLREVAGGQSGIAHGNS